MTEQMKEASKTEQLAEILRNSKKLVAFTGAGISCPSGIPDFRSADGLYNQKSGTRYAPEQIISHSFFEKHAKEFYAFYHDKMLYPDAKPNAAHRFLSELETPERAVTVVTQNIDGLHTAAGSSHVCELHGSVLRNHCTQCERFFPLGAYLDARDADGIPRCPSCGQIIKPDVVLYEESLDEDVINDAVFSISEADTLVIIGTSLVVYPAASFIRYFRGEHLILINKSETNCDSLAELVFHEDVVSVVEALKKYQF